jgi:hypothetical protein
LRIFARVEDCTRGCLASASLDADGSEMSGGIVPPI